MPPYYNHNSNAQKIRLHSLGLSRAFLLIYKEVSPPHVPYKWDFLSLLRLKWAPADRHLSSGLRLDSQQSAISTRV